jgi:prepilin-type N-terminal cleavage/methylation domain-containing protein
LQPEQTTKGFTLLEILVAVVIIGILSAIAAPTWLAFLNRQRVNKVNDTILSALQEAQTQAKKSKLSYSVWFFENNNNEVKYAVLPTKKVDTTKPGETTDVTDNDITSWNRWKPLGGDLEVKSKQLVLRSNLKSNNTANTAAVSDDFKTAKKITFDYMGTLPDANFGTPIAPSTDPPGLRIAVAVPDANSTQPSKTKRCVIVQTLIGGMRTAKDGECDK